MTFCVGTKSGIEQLLSYEHLLSYEYDRLFVLHFDSATCTRPEPRGRPSLNTFTLPNWQKIAALLSFSVSQENPLLGLKLDFSANDYLDGLLTSIADCNNQIVLPLVPLKTTGNGLCLVRILIIPPM